MSRNKPSWKPIVGALIFAIGAAIGSLIFGLLHG